MIKASIISIGDEILIGQIINTNAAFMGQLLNQYGIAIYEIVAVSDNAEHITKSLDQALAHSDIVLMTGGLGPTKDDITKKTLADYFGSNMVFHPDIWEDISGYLKKRQRPILESAKSLAYMPQNCTVIKNERGTAAAMWFEKAGKVIVAMPGIPHEMEHFMAQFIVPKLQDFFHTPSIYHKTVMCASLGETIAAEKVKSLVDKLPPHIKIAYLPHFSITRLRLSGSHSDAHTLQTDINNYAQEMTDLLGPKYAFGYDSIPLTQAIGNLLLAQNATMVTAESCTGGLIAHRITANSGCSAYYKGGVVTYSNALKQQLLGVPATTIEEHGAVSEATVKAMAQGAISHLQGDYAVAVSGIAGPGGGTPNKPVGTIWIAVANSSQVWAKKYTFARSRDVNIELTTNIALNNLRQLILGLL